MIGNEQERLAAVRWIASWARGTKPLLLVGPPGIGKTTLARILATQFDYDLVDMNASDTRNKASLRERILPVLSNTSNLLGRRILLFLDEVDGIAGREDSGGLEALTEMMKEPTVPVIMAANEKSAKIKDLAKVCKTIEFSRIPPRELQMFLDHVLIVEGRSLGPGDKRAAITTSGGDVRALLNNAQSRAAGYATGSKSAPELEISHALNRYFSSTSMEEAIGSFLAADASYPDPRFEGMSPELRRKDMIAALFSSILSSLASMEKDRDGKTDNMAPMLDIISKADMVVGRAGSNREWALLKYVAPMLSQGLYELTRNKGIKYSQYSLPWPLMGPLFARGQTTRKLAAALAPATITSRRICSAAVLPYLLQVLARHEPKVDIECFALENFGDESVAESLVKVMERKLT